MAGQDRSVKHSLPPAQPIYVFRGHVAQIHTVTFIRSNSRLITGDANGWIVIWRLTTKRPVAVWKAHNNAILGTEAWGNCRIMTDNKFLVWALGQEEEESMDTTLPVDDTDVHRRQPWLLHAIDVNTLNFCSFAVCRAENVPAPSSDDKRNTTDVAHPLLIAVPNAIKSDSIDILHLPSEHRVTTVPAISTIKTGMVMAVRVFHQAGLLTVAAGYESGHTALFQRNHKDGNWERLYACQPHTQPVLSLDLSSPFQCYFTSSADAIIAKHRVPAALEASDVTRPLQLAQTRHSGQQGLEVRSDGKIFATAGWDGRVRIYASRTTTELAVLKWHKEGCYAVAFAELAPIDEQSPKNGGLKAAEEAQIVAAQTIQQYSGNVAREREERARKTHWLAVGSKDGKVSLWDIY
ncbi:MAG: hypothetical protein M1812_001888 [Candelaria pacifica]|nr:MAG: hypothetical protein M1812_001888 [Candelaria pacifica]